MVKVQLNITIEEVKDILESYKDGNIDLEQAVDCIYFESIGTINLNESSQTNYNQSKDVKEVVKKLKNRLMEPKRCKEYRIK